MRCRLSRPPAWLPVTARAALRARVCALSSTPCHSIAALMWLASPVAVSPTSSLLSLPSPPPQVSFNDHYDNNERRDFKALVDLPDAEKIDKWAEALRDEASAGWLLPACRTGGDGRLCWVPPACAFEDGWLLLPLGCWQEITSHAACPPPTFLPCCR